MDIMEPTDPRLALLPPVPGCYRRIFNRGRIVKHEEDLLKQIDNDIVVMEIYLRRLNPYQGDYKDARSDLEQYLTQLRCMRSILYMTTLPPPSLSLSASS